MELLSVKQVLGNICRPYALGEARQPSYGSLFGFLQIIYPFGQQRLQACWRRTAFVLMLRLVAFMSDAFPTAVFAALSDADMPTATKSSESQGVLISFFPCCLKAGLS